MDKYRALVEKAKDASSRSATDWKIWCSVRKTKKDGAVPSAADEVRSYAKQMEGREPLTIKQHLLDLDHAEDLVDRAFAGEEEGGAGEGTGEDAGACQCRLLVSSSRPCTYCEDGPPEY